jgi:Bacterial Ig-like domain (group 1)
VRIRFRPGAVPALALLAGALACAGDGTPTEGPFVGQLAVVPEYPAAAAGTFAGLVVDAARVQVQRGTVVVLDTTVAFPASASSISLALRVPLESRIERLQVSLALLGGPTVLFAGSAPVEVTAERDGSPARPTIPLQYVGPGANVASLVITPKDPTVPPGSTVTLSVAGFDASGSPVPAFYVNWRSSDSRVTVGLDGQVVLPSDRAVVAIEARTPTGVSATTTIVVAPPATSFAITGGDNQRGFVGAALPLPLVVRVAAGDGGGVLGAAVRFQAGAGITPSDVVVTTQVDGTASLPVTLGIRPGPASVTATVAGLGGTATFHLTADAGPVSRLSPAAGAGQTGTVGTPLGALFAVQAFDQFDNPVPGVTIQWSAVAGGGGVTPSSGLTDGQGLAQARLTPGPLPVANVASAAAAGTTLAYRFAALVRSGPAGAVVALVGSGDTDGAPTVGLLAQVRDGLGNPVSGVPVVWQLPSGFGAFLSANSTSGAGGLVGATFQPDINGGNSVVRVVVSGTPTAFADFSISQGTPNTRIAIAGGGAQGGVVGQPLPSSVLVELTDSDFLGVPGVPLTWSVAAGSGSFAPLPVVTNGSGLASVTYTAGPVAGRQVGRVSEPVSGVAAVGIWDLVPAGVSDLHPFAGDGQTGAVGTPLGADLVVLVVDGFGNPIPGVTVLWSAPSGSFDVPSSTTNGQGQARVRFTPGASGLVSVEARGPVGHLTHFQVVAP